MSFPWSAGEKVNATHFNEIATAGVQIVTLGETIDASPVPKAVYIKNSDGKAWRTDAANFDEKIRSYAGLLIEDGNANDTKMLRTNGVVDGFSGLTVGTEYSLAKAGTSQADATGGNSNSGVSNDIGTGSASRYARKITTTEKGKLISFTIRLRKQSSPAGNLVCEIRKGTPSGSGSSGGGIIVGSKSLTPGSVSTSFSNVVFTFSTPIILESGDYYALLYDDNPGGAGNYQVESDAGSTTAYFISGGTWANNAANSLFTFDFSSTTFAAGELTDYFYTYKKVVGVAISATEIELQSKPSVVGYISKTVDTLYIAETDGLVIANNSSTDATDMLTGYKNGDSVVSGGRCIVMPVQAGDAYMVLRSDTGNTVVMQFVPLI